MRPRNIRIPDLRCLSRHRLPQIRRMHSHQRLGSGTFWSQHVHDYRGAVKASILERSPQHQKLYRLLNSLEEKKHYNECIPYFTALRLQAALYDLSSEDPTFRIAIASSRDANHAMLVQHALLVTPDDILAGPKDSPSRQLFGLNATGTLGTPLGHLIAAAQNTQVTNRNDAKDIAVSSVAFDTVHQHPLAILASPLFIHDSMQYPLVPIMSHKPKIVHYPVHQTFVIHYHKQLEQPLVDEADKSLLYHVIDLPADEIQAAPPNETSGQPSTVPFRISSELASRSLIMLGNTNCNIDEIKKAWKGSRVDDLKDFIQQSVKRKVLGPLNSLPLFIQDSIATILTPSLSDTLIKSPVPVVPNQTSEMRAVNDAVHQLMRIADLEIRQNVMIFQKTAVTLNPLTARRKLATALNFAEETYLQNTEVDALNLRRKLMALHSDISSESEAMEIQKTPWKSPSNYMLVEGSPSSSPTRSYLSSKGQWPQWLSPILGTLATGRKAPLPERLRSKAFSFSANHRDNGAWTHQAYDTDTPSGINIGIPNLFQSMRCLAHAMGLATNENARKSTRELFKTSVLASTGGLLLLYGGYDSAVAVSLWVIMVGYAGRRWDKEMRTHIAWFSSGLEQYSKTRMIEMKDWFEKYANGDTGSPEDIAKWKNKKEELEMARKELAKARNLLLEINPALKARYPEWTLSSLS